MGSRRQRGPDRPAETRDDSPHQQPRSERDVDRGRQTTRDVIKDHEVVDDDDDAEPPETDTT